MKKLKIPLTAVALMLGAASAFATKAATAIPSTATVWQFDGQTLPEDKEAANYTNITGQNPPTCSGTGLPCYIVVSSGTLQDYLNSHTAQEIRDDAPAQKQ